MFEYVVPFTLVSLFVHPVDLFLRFINTVKNTKKYFSVGSRFFCEIHQNCEEYQKGFTVRFMNTVKKTKKMNEMLEKIGQNQDSQAQNFEQDFVFFDPELKCEQIHLILFLLLSE
ncbi:hypothetical protein DEO72_LG6g2045 [Vigna unguiculata]|uniref:Uncharacterized protein n=1 Tax=Vigna unguiculata TaxID=3917 RepID=A0A4D6M7V3_VIGUN|nr:hypothetical protein DEO72_LG6g2045 [Vigna unguiculata]